MDRIELSKQGTDVKIMMSQLANWKPEIKNTFIKNDTFMYSNQDSSIFF